MNPIEQTVRDAWMDMNLALKDFTEAKLAEIQAQHTWDDWYLRQVAQGNLTGKNSEERLGNAILANTDEWYTLKRAREKLIEADGTLKLARNNDKLAGRLIVLETGMRFEPDPSEEVDGDHA
jgi:hypothetical protein